MDETEFRWRSFPEAAVALDRALDAVVARSRALSRLRNAIYRRTGTPLTSWLDHLVLPDDDFDEDPAALGFERRSRGAHPDGAFVHPSASFPPLLLSEDGGARVCLAVDSVVSFLLAHGGISEARIEGEPMGKLRRACLTRDGEVEIWAVERSGACGFEPQAEGEAKRTRAARVYESFLSRPRPSPDDSETSIDAAFDEWIRRVRQAAEELDPHWATALFFRAERDHYERRNWAALAQRHRQDDAGLGWGAVDHHTYRSSRERFHRLLEAMKCLGLERRERFFAGAEAGWGAQVLEHPVHRFTVFTDVDLTAEEIALELGDAPLSAGEELGTVGLWCALHGESALSAGLHHVAIPCDFDELTEQLSALGIERMAPFSDFPELRQAFTVAERWPVAAARLSALVAKGAMPEAEAEHIGKEGALGSHVELIERHHGFKGFNQSAISEVIRATDPRETRD